ncbi:MAG: hypothetical protein EHM47_11120, partial [Ignavibacteriales bacterium]
MSLRVMIILLILFSAASLYSQQRQFTGGTISGIVYDKSTGHAIEYANLVVISKTDSSVVTGTVS